MEISSKSNDFKICINGGEICVFSSDINEKDEFLEAAEKILSELAEIKRELRKVLNNAESGTVTVVSKDSIICRVP